jgi:hypothetical protein
VSDERYLALLTAFRSGDHDAATPLLVLLHRMGKLMDCRITTRRPAMPGGPPPMPENHYISFDYELDDVLALAQNMQSILTHEDRDQQQLRVKLYEQTSALGKQLNGERRHLRAAQRQRDYWDRRLASAKSTMTVCASDPAARFPGLAWSALQEAKRDVDYCQQKVDEWEHVIRIRAAQEKQTSQLLENTLNESEALR